MAKTWDGGGLNTDWNTGANWNPDGVPGSADDVTLDGAALAVTAGSPAISFNTLTIGNSGGTNTVGLTLSTTIAAGGNTVIYKKGTLTSATVERLAITGSLTMYSGAVFAHSDLTTLPAASVNLKVTGNFDLQAGASIAVAGLGYDGSEVCAAANCGNGPGRGCVPASKGGNGAGHGGWGGYNGSDADPGGFYYDSVNDPSEHGSGGSCGNSLGDFGGDGGGLVKLEVQGTFTLNGKIDAIGTDGIQTARGGGGGSGGAVNIVAAALAGSGTVDVTGGRCPTTNAGGSGAGGRIALAVANSDTSSLTLLANGGFVANSGVLSAGAQGTIYYKKPGEPNARLIIPQVLYTNGVATVVSLPAALVVDTLTLVNVNFVSTQTVLTVTSSLTIDNINQTYEQVDLGPLTVLGGLGLTVSNNTRSVISTVTVNGPARFTSNSGIAVASVTAYGTLDVNSNTALSMPRITAAGALTFNGNSGMSVVNIGASGAVNLISNTGSSSFGSIAAGGNFTATGNTGLIVNSATSTSAGAALLSNNSGSIGSLSFAGDLTFSGNNGLTAGPTAAGGAVAFTSNSNTTVAVLNPPGALSFTTNPSVTLTSATFRVNPTFTGANTIYISTLATTTHLTVPANTAILHHALGLWDITGNLTVGGTLTQDALGTWAVSGDLTVQNGGVLTHNANSANLARRLNVTVGGNLDLQSGGQINADGKGYGAGLGPNPGGGEGAASGGAGGGHGGAGGSGGNVAVGGAANDSFNVPANLGSGGGSGSGAGGAGGGLVKLTVSGASTVNGVLSANGGAGTAGTGGNTLLAAGGGGAGGAIHLITNTFGGSGAVRALGGAAGNDTDGGDDTAGGGGGGLVRIDPVSYNTNVFTGMLDVSGGARSSAGGGSAAAGYVGIVEASTATLANSDGGQRTNSIVVGNLTGAALFAFNLKTYTRDMQVNSLVVALSAVNGVGDGDWANVKLYEDTNGNGWLDAGETTQVGGAGAVNTAGGTITFSTPFAISTTGKNYLLTADLAAVASGDAFTLNLSTANIALVSAANTTEKGLQFNGGSVAGATHSAGAPVIWDGGAGDGKWHTADNWNPNAVPVAQSAVTIDANVTVYADASQPGIRFDTLTLGSAGGTFSPNLVLSTGIAAGGTALLVYKNATLTQNMLYQVNIPGSLTVFQGGKLTHTNNTTARNYVLDLKVGGLFDLKAGSTMTADSLGYSGGYGAGAGMAGALTGGAGGGYGAFGGAGGAGTARGGAQYGGVSSVTDLGSGGGAGNGGAGGAGGAGGGEIHITAGTLTLNGLISANGIGGVESTTAGGGGSGGGIQIAADTISGTGTVAANGGAGGSDTNSSNETAGGGAGGRVVLLAAAADTSNLNLQAYPGARGTYLAASTAFNGGPGTIYYKRPGQPAYDLRIGGLGNTVVAGASTTVTGATVTVDTFTATRADVWFAPGSVVTLSSATVFSSSMTVSTLTIRGTGLRVTGSSVLLMLSTAQLYVTGDMSLESGALWRHGNNTTTEQYRLDARVLGGLSISAGAVVDLAGLGYSGADRDIRCGYGPGGGCNTSSGDGGSGAGHGGYGGEHGNSNGWLYRGYFYDSVTDPREQGSGGAGGDGAGEYGGAGGGAALIDVGGTFALDGLINVNGGAGTGSASRVGGGGSGGAVNIRAGTLTGAGSITAAGGKTPGGAIYAGGGAGGRIAVVATTADTSSLLIAAGGGYTNAGNCGGAGTIFYKKHTDPYGQIIISSISFSNIEPTVISLPASITVDTITLVNVSFISSQTAITVTSSLTISNINQVYELVNMKGPVNVLGGLGLTLSNNTYNTISSVTVSAPAKFLSNTGITVASVTVTGTLDLTSNANVALSRITAGGAVNMASNSGLTSAWGNVTGALSLTSNSNTTVSELNTYGALTFTTNPSVTLTSATFRTTPSFSGANAVSVSTLTATASLSVPANTTLTHTALGKWEISGDLTVGGTLIQNALGKWTVGGNMTVQNTGRIYHNTNTTAIARKLDITVGSNLDIQSGAQVYGDASGYAGGYGPNPGGVGSDIAGGGGGGHGGAGGAGGAAGGAANDSLNAPVNLGSGGGSGSSGGGTGGGYVKLAAGGLATVNGLLSANGGAGAAGSADTYDDINLIWYYYSAGGGGAGGSIYLVCDGLNGSGVIRATGGAGGTDPDCAGESGGGGGGGIFRADVANYYYNDFSGTIDVTGGAGGCGSSAGAVGIVEPSTAALTNNAGGQRGNSITIGDITSANLFGFKLTAYTQNIRVQSLALSLSAVTGIADGDWANVKLYEDTNGNGRKDGSETTQVGGAGAVNTGGGLITFSTPFTVTTAGNNYVLTADLAGLADGDTFRLDLGTVNMTLVSQTNTTEKALQLKNSGVTGVTHTAGYGVVWDGGAGDLKWHSAENWAPNIVPVSQSQVTINANATVAADAAQPAIRFDTLTLGSAGGTYAPTLVLSTGTAGAPSAVSVYKNATLTQNMLYPVNIPGNLTVYPYGKLTHTGNTTARTYILDFQVGGTFDLQAGATIAAAALGYSGGPSASDPVAGYGPGKGNIKASRGGAGAGYGALGGAGGDGNAPGGLQYGEVSDVTEPGSGGGGGDNNGGGGGAGGGEVHITAGTLTLNGFIDASATAGGNGGGAATAGGGGSGGGVEITAGAIAGAGTVSVNGGAGGNDSTATRETGGGGAGGRIVITAVSADTSALNLQAYPGARGTYSAASTAFNGGPGTIYYKRPGQPAYDLRIGGLGNTVVAGASTTVTGATVTVDTFTATLADVWFAPGSVVTMSSATVFASSMTVSTLTIRGTGLRVTGSSVLLMLSTAQLYVTGDMSLESGALWRHGNNTTTEQYKLNAKVLGGLTISAGAVVDLAGLGYSGLAGNLLGCGYGPGGACKIATPTNGGSGAGHGGFGGRQGNVGTVRGLYYDSVTNPALPGSGGAGGDLTAEYGGSGGGAALIDVGGTFTLNGLINVDGGPGLGAPGNVGGGGSGGAVNIRAGGLAGGGAITAVGGATPAGATNGGGGAGGRVALVAAASDTSALTISVNGGYTNSTNGAPGADGTVYYKKPGDPNGSLLIRAQTYTNNEPTVVSLPAALTIDTMTLVNVNFISSQTAITVTSSLTISNIDQVYELVDMKGPVNVLGGLGLTLSNNTYNTISSVTVSAPAKFLSNTGITVASVTVTGTLDLTSNANVALSRITAGGAVNLLSNSGLTSAWAKVGGALSLTSNSNTAVSELDSYGALNFTTNPSVTLTSATFRANPAFSGANSLNISTLTTTAHLTVPANTAILHNALGLWDIAGNLTVGGALTQDALGTWAVSGDLTVQNGGVLTHNANSGTLARRLNITVGGNLGLQSGGQINADGKGYGAGYGPNPGGYQAASSGGGGGGHGGAGGGGGGTATGGAANDSFNAPANLGSGGGNGNSAGGPGGGLVKLTVSGDSTINGVLSANGGAGTDGTAANALLAAGGGGAGGSIYLITNTFGGSGAIRALGGAAGNDTDSGDDAAGGGGGGLIRIDPASYEPNLYSGMLDVSGGARSSPGGGNAAAGYLGITEASTATLANNAGGQRGNSISVGNITEANLFGFRLNSYIQNMQVNSLVVALSAVGGVGDGDWANIKIYEDANGNARKDAGETTQAGGAGVVNTAGGTITFSTPFAVTLLGKNYIITADLANLAVSDTFRLNLSTANIALVSAANTTEKALQFSGGSVTGVTHTASYAVAWDGGGSDGKWHTSFNWNPDVIPVSQSLVTIDANATVTADASQPGVRFDTLTLGSAGGTNAPDLVLSTGIAGAPTAVTIYKRASLTQATTWQLNIPGNLTIYNGGVLRHADIGSLSTAAVNVRIGGNFDLQAGASIAVAGLGFDGYPPTPSTPNCGWGPGAGCIPAAGNQGGVGAGHGGFGGGNSDGVAVGGSYYDSVTAPVQHGSGGSAGNGADGKYGGNGGGLVLLAVNGTFTLNGNINTNGTDGYTPGGRSGGGGSGGTVNILAGTLAGGGTITSDGGKCSNSTVIYSCGGGSGGRIAVVSVTGDTSALSLAARGGRSDVVDASGSSSGAEGTVYQKKPSEANGRIVVSSISFSGSNGAPTQATVISLPASLTIDTMTLVGVNFISTQTAITVTSSMTIASINTSGKQVSMAPLTVTGGLGLSLTNNTVTTVSTVTVYAPAKFLSNSNITVASVTVTGTLDLTSNTNTILSGITAGGALNLTSNTGLTSARAAVAGALGFTSNTNTTISVLDPAGALAFTTNPSVTLTSATFRVNPTFTGANTIYISTLATTTHLTVPANTAILHYALGLWNITGNLTVGGALTQDALGTWAVSGDLTVQNGGVLTHNANTSTLARRINITVGGNLDLQSGGQINADGKGYGAGLGPNPGGSEGAASGGGGGGHGGAGGAGGNVAAGGAANDSFNVPANLGSGGGSGSGAGGAGGGLVKLTVGGASTVNGVLSANGGAGTAGTGGNAALAAGGGGAGGAIYLITNTFGGSGAVRALGGAAGNDTDGAGDTAGGGGGGLIRIDPVSYNTNVFTGMLDVSGGARSSAGGGSAAAGYVGIVEASTASLANSDGGQRPNSIVVGNLTGVDLFGFKLLSYTRDMQVNSLVVALSAASGVGDGDWANIKLYEDANGNGLKDTGETTQVGGAGAVNTAGGTITFSTPFGVTTAGKNYILTADLANLAYSDTFRLNLSTANIALVSAANTTEQALQFINKGVAGVTHSASNITWDGGGGDLNWHTANNWNPNGVPGAANEVTLDVNSLNVAVSESSPAINFSLLKLGQPAGANTVSLTLSTGIASGGSVIVYRNASLVSGTTSQITVTGNVTLYSGGVLRHADLATLSTAAVNMQITGNFDLQAGASIAAAGLGYDGQAPNATGCASGPGGACKTTASYGGSGGGHGGFGGREGAAAGFRGFYYDSATNPALHGSGGAGGDAGGEYGGAGGGLVQLSVQGAFMLNGLVSADGGTGLGSGAKTGGGGSGGSVNITAGSLAGNGGITANGGLTSPGATNAGSGAGGRIAVVAVSADTSVLAIAARGGFTDASAGSKGADGTVYYKKPGDPYGALIVAAQTYADNEPTVLSVPASLTIDTMTLVNVNFISTQTALVVTSSITIGSINSSGEQAVLKDLTVKGGLGLVFSGNSMNASVGNLTAAGPLSFVSNSALALTSATFRVDPSFSGTNSLTISSLTTTVSLTVPANTTLTHDVYGTWAIGGGLTLGGTMVQDALGAWTVANNLTVQSDGLMTHNANAAALAKKLDVTVGGALDIQAGGAISVSGKGYSSGNGPNPGASGASTAGGGGGGHGGAGGTGGNSAAGGAANDSFNVPANLGSGGGPGAAAGGAGGGYVKLNVTGLTTVNGLLAANGAAGADGTGGNAALAGGGGGAGGSIYLITGSLAGGGDITAQGGGAGDDPDGGDDTAGGGGGGLIRVHAGTYQYNDFAGTLNVDGGARSVTEGGNALDGRAGFLEPATGALADNDGGQRTDSLAAGSNTGINLFGFKLTSYLQNMQVNTLAIPLSSVVGVVSGDFANIKLFEDGNGNGIKDGGETTQVGGAGSASISAGAGTLTFSTAFAVSSTTGKNYIMVADVNNMANGDGFTLKLSTGDITLVSATNTTKKALKFSGGASAVTHASSEVSWDGGGGDGKWHTAANWNPDFVPVANSVAIINVNASVTSTAAVAFQTLTMGNVSGTTITTLFLSSPAAGVSLTLYPKATLVSGTSQQHTLTGSLDMFTGSSMTHATNGNLSTATLNMLIGGDFNLQAGATIAVTAKGYKGGIDGYPGTPGSGPCGGVNAGNTDSQSGGGGGGYGGAGGKGGNTSGGAGGGTCGSAADPDLPGSGGGGGTDVNGDPGAPGGGLVRIEVAGHITLDGYIVANGTGAARVGSRGGGGSGAGGAIKLKAGSISGSGTLQADGGPSPNITNGGSGGGGGGGRIAIESQNQNLCALTVSAAAGTAGTSDKGAGVAGKVGTLYNSKGGSCSGTKFWNGEIDSNWYTADNWTPSGVPGSGDDLGICPGVVQVAASSPPVNFHDLMLGNTGDSGCFSGVSGMLTLSTGIAVGNDIVINNGGQLIFGTTHPVTLNGNLTLLSGSTITHSDNALAVKSALVNLKVGGKLDVQGGAYITANAVGYDGASPGGAGYGPGASIYGSGGQGSGGAGHGGAGGAGASAGGAAYGVLLDPVDLGSGAGGGQSNANTTPFGGAGGGAVLVVANTVNIDGVIQLNGGGGGIGDPTGPGRGAGGGGSGGSVNIKAVYFTGAGAIEVKGGAGGTDGNGVTNYGGGGSGGRIGINVSNSGSICSLIISTAGGTGRNAGAYGTLSSTAPLARTASFTGAGVNSTGIKWDWQYVSAAQGYRIYSSTGGAGQSPGLSAGTSSYIETGLLPNTTYTRNVSAFHCSASSASANYDAVTLAKHVVNGQLLGVFSSSITAGWAAFPAAPPAASSDSGRGYILQASTASNFTGQIFFSSTSVLASSTLTVQGLQVDTTYYLRAGSYNWAWVPNYIVIGSTITSFYDCGLRFFDGAGVVRIGCENPGGVTSKIRIYQKGAVYGIPPVDLTNPRASKMRIQTQAGTRALPKVNSVASGGGGGASSRETFEYSGTYAYIVPAGCASVTVKAWGAGGGSGGATPSTASGAAGGGAGYAKAVISATPGESLSVTVGGGGQPGLLATGYGGGGGGGGGFSGVERAGADLVIAAGGAGGGAGYSSTAGGAGGAGGGATGTSGGTISNSTGGGGGTSSAGGAAGTGDKNGVAGAVNAGGRGGAIPLTYSGGGMPGGGGNGGDKGAAGFSGAGGGGGGGGYYGGGGGGAKTSGASSGGGGGSGHVSGTSTVLTAGSGTSAANTGDADYAGGAGAGAPAPALNTQGTAGNPGRVVITCP